MKKLLEHVIESSEAAESSQNVNMLEDEKHDGVVLFGGSPVGSDGVDAKLYRPTVRGVLMIETFVVVFPLVVPLVHPVTHSLGQLLVHSLAVSLVLSLASSLVHQ